MSQGHHSGPSLSCPQGPSTPGKGPKEHRGHSHVTGQREVFTPSQNTSLQRLVVSAPKTLPPRQPVGAADLLSSPTPDLRVNEIFRSQCRQTGLSIVLWRPQPCRSMRNGQACYPSLACLERRGHPHGLWDKDLAVRSELLCLRWCLLLSSAQELAVTGHTPRPSPPNTGRGTSDLLPPLGVL